MEAFKNIKILVVCKETLSYPFYFLVKKWKEDNMVAAFFFNPCETQYAESTLNDTTYYAYKKLQGVRLFTSDKITEEFIGQQNDKKVCDEAFLKSIENKYTHFQNLNQQILSTQFFTRHYHYRNYMHSCTYYQQLNWLVLNYKNVISIINEFKPDVVLDCDCAELARCVMREVCYKETIPYVVLDHPRYELYKLFSYNLGHKYSKLFERAYDKHLAENKDSLRDEYACVDEFRNRGNIMNAMFKNDITAQYNPPSIRKTFGTIWYSIKYFIKQDFAGGNYKLKRSCPLLFPSSYQYIKYYTKRELKKQYLMRKNKYFKDPVEGEKYVYMPLHLIPESTTFTLSPLYINELSIIEAVSKSLPAGWWLYVKEHQAMVGERSVDFYEKANRIPNVRMVQLNFYKDPKPWIVKSQGVVTISGTAAYEAALLGKRAILFTDVPFSIMEGISRLHSFEHLAKTIQDFDKPLDNKQSCAAYIASIKELGCPVNLKVLLGQGQAIIRGKTEMSEEYQENLGKLEKLFLMGYYYYKDERELENV